MAESLPQNFNHLKIHTQYSICEGAIKIDDLQEYSKSNKIKSLGLCDTSNLCGALEFAEKISKFMTQLDYYLCMHLMKKVIKILLISHQYHI